MSEFLMGRMLQRAGHLTGEGLFFSVLVGHS